MASVLKHVEETSTKTLVEYGTERLLALCKGLGVPALSSGLCECFSEMAEPWGHQPVGALPRYRSNIADDEAPFEFSVALSDGPAEVQFYVEAQGEPPTLESNMLAGRALVDRLAAKPEHSFDRFRAIEDLFLPREPHGAFTIWIGASATPGTEVQLKAYLNPQVRTAHVAPRLLADAMKRLGLEQPWDRVQAALLGNTADEVSILSLDLSNHPEARVKVYVRHHSGHRGDIHRLASLASDYVARDVDLFYDVLGAGAQRFGRKPLITELSFTRRVQGGPSSVTVEFPIGSYVANDHLARLRVGECLRTFGLSSQRYDAVIEAFAPRPLTESRGVHAHVTLRRIGTRPRIAVYFASDAYVS